MRTYKLVARDFLNSNQSFLKARIKHPSINIDENPKSNLGANAPITNVLIKVTRKTQNNRINGLEYFLFS